MLSSSSSQLRNWTFSSLEEVARLRRETNASAREAYRLRCGAGAADPLDACLTVAEEGRLVRHYQAILEQLCDKTEPPVPRHVRAVAVTYVRRFYLHNSAMDLYPREVMLTAIWVAMKTEEFNLSLAEFGRCIPRNAAKYTDIIRASELFLIERLNYDLLVHVPSRAADGLLAEWRAFLAAEQDDDEDEEEEGGLRDLSERAIAKAAELAHRAVHTDAVFVATPAQIAFAALWAAVESAEDERLGARLAEFTLDRLCHRRRDVHERLVEKAASLAALVAADRPVLSAESAAVEDKLERCRNPEFNFDSDLYRARKAEWRKRYEKL